MTSIHSKTDSAALVRLQADHVTRTLVPSFYRYLQAQDAESQIAGGKEFHDALQKLVDLLERAEKEGDDLAGSTPVGLWHENGTLGWTDVMVGPCKCYTPSRPKVYLPPSYSFLTLFFLGLFRATNVLWHCRGFRLPSGMKFRAWIDRLFQHPAFECTCSTEELYLDSYER
jgi:glutathione S-transferase